MNLTEIPDKITVRLDPTDKLNLQAVLRARSMPGLSLTTADAYRLLAAQAAKEITLRTKPDARRRRK